MIEMPIFAKNPEWYSQNEDGEFILTSKAPQEAIDDYKKRQKEYNDKVNKMSIDEYIDFINSEDGDFKFPLYNK